MTHLGVYYAPEHGFQVDRDYIAALQPPVIRVLDPDVQHIADMHALAPNAIIAPRTWAIDDGSDEDHPSKQVNRLMADPVGTGRDHAQQYRGQLDRWQQEASQRGLRLPPAERLLFNSANEPNQGGSPDKIAAYCIAFLDRCTELGIRACGPCLGVGWPDNTGPDTPVDWTPYAGLDQAIKRNGGMLSIHEYFYKTGPQDTWRWWAGRHLQCPFDVPILLGEIGIDNYVANERWQAEPEDTRGNRGWQGNVSPDVYAEMIEWHIAHSDRRVVAALPFITDFRNNSWESFNTRPAHNALLARKDRMVPQAAPPTTPTQPTPTNTLAYVTAPAGLNLRASPINGAIITAVPYAEQIRILGVMDTSGWLRVRYREHEGYMAAQYVGLVAPEPLPAPSEGPQPVEPPIGDNWGRAWPIVLNIEGGLSTDRSDKGNYRPDGTFVGTRWGISALSHPDVDIINLSKEDALKIYHRDYWLGSGADKLPWPLALLHFDAYVQNQVSAKTFLAKSNGNPLVYLAERIEWYTTAGTWDNHGRGWMRRCARMLREVAKA